MQQNPLIISSIKEKNPFENIDINSLHSNKQNSAYNIDKLYLIHYIIANSFLNFLFLYFICLSRLVIHCLVI